MARFEVKRGNELENYLIIGTESINKAVKRFVEEHRKLKEESCGINEYPNYEEDDGYARIYLICEDFDDNEFKEANIDTQILRDISDFPNYQSPELEILSDAYFI